MHICDLHCDTVHMIGDGSLRRIDNSHLDLERMRASDYKLQTFAAFVEAKSHPDRYAECLRLIDILRRQLDENDDIISPVLSGGDIDENFKCGKMSALLSVEEGGVIEGSLSRVDELYHLGVRMMTFTWNYDNELASSVNGSAPDTGLTPLGIDFLHELEAHRMIADVSHLSDNGIRDVIAHASRPFIASHSNSRAVHNVNRNLTDDMIRSIGNIGGLIGLNFYSAFIGGDGSMDFLCRHARHIADVGGSEILALGSDFDGIDYNPYFPDCTAVKNFPSHLKSVGFKDSEIDGIMGGNAVRFFKENL